MTAPTFCRDCDHVERESRKRPAYYWLCLQHPTLQGHGFVDPDTWTNGAPYLRCSHVNGGICKLFKPTATPQTSMDV